MDKSAFFWTQQSFKYEYGRVFRGKNLVSLDHGGFFEINDFETNERRNAIWASAIHVGDLLIPGSGAFVKYILPKERKKSSRLTAMKKMKRRTSE